MYTSLYDFVLGEYALPEGLEKKEIPQAGNTHGWIEINTTGKDVVAEVPDMQERNDLRVFSKRDEVIALMKLIINAFNQQRPPGVPEAKPDYF